MTFQPWIRTSVSSPTRCRHCFNGAMTFQPWIRLIFDDMRLPPIIFLRTGVRQCSLSSSDPCSMSLRLHSPTRQFASVPAWALHHRRARNHVLGTNAMLPRLRSASASILTDPWQPRLFSKTYCRVSCRVGQRGISSSRMPNSLSAACWKSRYFGCSTGFTP